MKRKNYKLLVCALTMANFGFLGFNNCSAASSIEPNVTENHPVMENIISSEKMTKLMKKLMKLWKMLLLILKLKVTKI